MNASTTPRRWPWWLLFLLLIAVSLWVPLYNRIGPRLLGIPFFYWFQFVWIMVTAVVTALAYRARA
ncbi:MAG TPA: DUF3311 domain-containing protein [Rhodanobacteraceae bacterium]|nr:DUF3311 domain-containing protein [Rhodanobacteraceae bacterium]